MVQGMDGLPRLYHNTWQAVTAIVKEEGARGLFRGIWPNYFKARSHARTHARTAHGIPPTHMALAAGAHGIPPTHMALAAGALRNSARRARSAAAGASMPSLPALSTAETDGHGQVVPSMALSYASYEACKRMFNLK
jgi:hypothetical protein